MSWRHATCELLKIVAQSFCVQPSMALDCPGLEVGCPVQFVPVASVRSSDSLLTTVMTPVLLETGICVQYVSVQLSVIFRRDFACQVFWSLCRVVPVLVSSVWSELHLMLILFL